MATNHRPPARIESGRRLGRAPTAHLHPSDLRGLGRLAIDATRGMTDLVEALHHTIVTRPGVLGSAPSGRTAGVTGLVYGSIRGVTTLVGGALDLALRPLALVQGQRASSPEREAVLAALNGILGDHLAATRNPLAIPMRLRHQGRALELRRAALAATVPEPTGKLLLLIHGLCRNDLQWTNQGAEPAGVSAPGPADGGPMPGTGKRACTDPADGPWLGLARDLDYTPVALHYNSGRHISTNGRQLAELLETLVASWPVPIRELVIVAHSMGGLVARSAGHYAAQGNHRWLQRLRTIVFVATPHHGAPLERGGNWVDSILGASPYAAPFARLGKIRSAGITDLRHGSLVDEDWQGHDRFARTGHSRRIVPLPAGVRCHAIAATTGNRSGDLVDRLLGDGLVPVDSALGRHPRGEATLSIPRSRQWVAYGTGHLQVLEQAAVHDQVRRWLAHPRGGQGGSVTSAGRVSR